MRMCLKAMGKFCCWKCGKTSANAAKSRFPRLKSSYFDIKNDDMTQTLPPNRDNGSQESLLPKVWTRNSNSGTNNGNEHFMGRWPSNVWT